MANKPRHVQLTVQAADGEIESELSGPFLLERSQEAAAHGPVAHWGLGNMPFLL